jgi:hypothetical protein
VRSCIPHGGELNLGMAKPRCIDNMTIHDYPRISRYIVVYTTTGVKVELDSLGRVGGVEVCM